VIRKRVLGSTGIEVSEIGFGAWAIGGRGYGAVEDSEAVDAVAAYVEAGGGFIDTARNYARSEELIGRALAEQGARDRVVIATKTHRARSAEDLPLIREELETSLRLLQTEVIDLYFIHSPPEDPDLMNRALDEFSTLKEEGKIRAVGASIKGPDVTDQTVELCKQYVNSGRIDAIQLIYSILRQRNRESIEYAQGKGVGIVARTVLESGFLTGKYKPGHRFPDDDHRRRWQGEHLAGLLAEIEELGDLAVKPPYQSLAEVAIRFALLPSGVSTTIPGGRNRRQVEANLKAADRPPLPPDVLFRLSQKYAGFTENANTGG
jgi:aryl-alcohol dehydrogenase-like predicted oxidoreductase